MRNWLFALLMLILTSGVAGCTKKACERVCDCRADNGVEYGEEDTENLYGKEYIKECVKVCENDLEDKSGACKRAHRKWARCVDGEGCNFEQCESEYDDYGNEC